MPGIRPSPVTVEGKDLIDYLRTDPDADLNAPAAAREEFLATSARTAIWQHTLEEILKGANQLLEEHEAESELDLNVAAFTMPRWRKCCTSSSSSIRRIAARNCGSA